jgi:drug/metabolite transporter (DMT)-like permease
MPQGIDWLYLLLIGILTQLGQVNLTKSLQAERIAIVSSLNYLGILYALVLGIFFFNESYTVSILTGIILVVSGVLLNIIFGKKEHVLVTDDE